MFTSNSQCFSPFQSTVDRVIPCAAQNGQYFIKQQVAFKIKMGITNKRRDVLYRCYRVDQFFVDTVHQMGLFDKSEQHKSHRELNRIEKWIKNHYANAGAGKCKNRLHKLDVALISALSRCINNNNNRLFRTFPFNRFFSHLNSHSIICHFFMAAEKKIRLKYFIF